MSAGRRSLAASIGAITSASAAATCCVGPLVFALLGIGGAGFLVQLEPFRPYFSAIALACLAGGFYVAYRRPKTAGAAAAAEGPSCACPSPRVDRAGKILLWIAAVVVVGSLGFPYLAPVLFG